MKIRKLVFNLAIAITTLLFGLAWVGFYQFFISTSPKNEYQLEGVTTMGSTSDYFENAKVSVELGRDDNWENADRLQVNMSVVAPDNKMNDALKMKDAVKDAADKVKKRAIKDAEYVEKQDPVSEEEFIAKLYIGGYYNFTDKTPVGFEDFHLEIWQGDYDAATDKFIDGIPSGFVLSRKKHHEFERFLFSKGGLSFSTFERDGVRFVFRGEYKRKVPIGKTLDAYGVLKGKLLRQKNGKTVANADAEFTWDSGC